ncbi:hypothetical protein F140042L4_19810 [Coprococcus phoceensis]
MSQEIIKVLDNLCEKFGIAIDWTSQNVVPYLKELVGRFINYEVVTSIFWIIVGVIAIIIPVIVIKKISKYAEKEIEEDYYSDWRFYQVVTIIFGSLIVFTFLIMILFQIYDIIECYTIPEKVIFDYLNSLTMN